MKNGVDLDEDDASTIASHHSLTNQTTPKPLSLKAQAKAVSSEKRWTSDERRGTREMDEALIVLKKIAGICGK